MALTIEDGTLVAGADSYVTVAEAKAYATKRGSAVFAALTDADIEEYIILAMDYIEGFRSEFKGEKVSSTQALQWPRQYVYIDDVLISNTTIPAELKNAVIQSAIEATAETLQPNTGGRTVTKERVDVVEVEYAARGAATDYKVFNKVLKWLNPLLARTGPLYSVRL
jgi:hypothetical protein